jgi:hypothetical protein
MTCTLYRHMYAIRQPASSAHLQGAAGDAPVADESGTGL